jgi:DNA-binding protein H-NS
MPIRKTAAATMKKIDAQIKRLQKQRVLLEQRTRGPIIASIVKLMGEHGISVGEIQAAVGKRRSGRPAKKASVAPKYRNRKSGETWSGRGRAPRWLVEAEAAGKTRENFLIKEGQ